LVFLQTCDWVACLKPPDPPPASNLRLTDWFGAPVPFNGTARYVCNRGMKFEKDPSQEYVEYTCQVRKKALKIKVTTVSFKFMEQRR
jgi:hypothetical protein